MFGDFDARNNQKQEDDEDSETLSYSYPSYSRFTYTGKTKSRLGRNRFMRQTDGKEENKKPDDSSSGSSHFLQSNSQAPKTPGVGWLQRDSSLAHPFTPGEHSRYPDRSSVPSQSNFLFNLKNDPVQNSNCKRNLPFSTTPFKTKEVHEESLGNMNPLKDLNQLLKPENPFSKLNFFGGSKEENKENSGKSKIENVKNNDLNPSWNQIKKICDAAVPFPTLTSIPETNKSVNTGDQSDIGKTDISRSNLFAPFRANERRDENKKDDDFTNTPLDLSSADSTVSRSLFSQSLMSGCDQLDSDTSGTLNRQLKDSTKESIGKADDSTQKTNTDALSGFLPKFLVPKNKHHQTDSPDDDVSAHSVGTVVERIFDFQPEGPFPQQMHAPHSQAPTRPQVTSSVIHDIGASSSQYKSTFQNDIKKSSPPGLQSNYVCKEPNPSPLPLTNRGVQATSQLERHHNTDKKSSPPNVLGNIYSLEPPKLSPPSAHSIPDVRNVMSDGQQLVKQEQNQHLQHSNNSKPNVPTIKNEKEVMSLAQHKDEKLRILSKSSNDHQNVNKITSGKSVDNLKSTNVCSNSTNEVSPPNQYNNLKLAESLNNPLASTQQRLPLSNQVQRSAETLNSVYNSGIQNQARPPVPLESGERHFNPASLQQANVVSKPAIDQKEPAMYSRPPENVQSNHLNQKTYLAPQQTMDRNSSGDFPHVKPIIPQLASSKPSFPAVKKSNTFKISGPRGMPSRADTELSVNGKSYAILSMLGKGGSSEVFQVLEPCSSKLLAVKCVDLSMVDKTIADGYLNEIDLLSRLQGCASVIRMFDYEYVQECKLLYVVMEKGDTDLSHLIRDISKTKKISMSMIIYYWTEMLQAVKDIHEQGIIHSDLKPANFLLVSGRLKLIDFGIASSQGDMTSVVKEVTTGTWNYMSPEAIKNTNASGKGFKITYKSDVWSLGCILYNLVYGKTPFSHITNTWGKLTAIADPNHCIEFPDVGAPAVLLKALRSCFHREPKLRPTVAELLSLPYHSTEDGPRHIPSCLRCSDLSSVGQQVKTVLPEQWWLKVAHLFPEVKSNQEEKNTENAG